MTPKPDHGAVRFHQPETQPYGAFSAFASTPVWIAGRRYPTVEHWYQANRGVGEEHEWIRSALSPEDAKLRGASIEPRRYWSDERVFIMYRGMLAKFRQHPPLAALLLSSGSAAIHLANDDPFWGFDNAAGHDWLGKILCHVRDSLRSPNDVDPFPGIDRIRFVNYEAAAAIRALRDDGPPWLVHLIRYRDAIDPIQVIRRVIESGLINASRQLNGYHAVCFSAAPVRALESRVFEREAQLRKAAAAHVYSPYGVAVTYDFGRELGLRPVLPVPTETNSLLPEFLRFLCQPYAPTEMFDYTHEDEWRAPFDVDIREGPFALVLPKGRTLALTPTYGRSRSELLRILDNHA